MWKNYSADYIRNNPAAGGSIMAASFIAALFLSFLCSMFYNFWLDSIGGTKMEDGDWHARIISELGEEELGKIRSFDNVQNVVVNKGVLGEGQTTADIYFSNKRTIYRDMQNMIKVLGLPQESVDYNYQLLSLYFIRIPGDEMPRLLMPAYLAIIAAVCFSLILVIHNSFAVSMNNRIHQFGIFASIGATPRQIRICLMQEAFALSAGPILAGALFGILFSYGTVRIMVDFTADLAGGREMDFVLHPAILFLILFLSFFTVFVSARIPAGKLSRLTLLEAIRGTGELQPGKKKNSPILSTLFGMEGELAGASLRAQKKALRTTSISLMFAFLGFMLMQCFFTLSGISTRHTYFEAYQDAWDVMVTVKEGKIEDFGLTDEVRNVEGAESCVIYQKAEAVSLIPAETISRELLSAGGLEKLAGISLSAGENVYEVKTPLVILDDKSFEEYCGEVGAETGTEVEGAVVLNRIWDSGKSNFRYPEYIPYINEKTEKITLKSRNPVADGSVEIPVLACAEEGPVLREEYGKSDCPLVLFISLSCWEKIEGQIGEAEGAFFIRILSEDRNSLEMLNELESSVVQILDGDFEVESENRIQEKNDNDVMIRGYELILGGFCALLAVIGIAHVFSNTAGFLRQRKREFARYMSVGVTPGGIWKIFCIESVVVVGRPMLAAWVLTTGITACMIRLSYLDPMEFIREAPVLPILLFGLTVFGFVALAYWLGGRKIARICLAEALRDDTML